MDYYIMRPDNTIRDFTKPQGISKEIKKEMLYEENIYKLEENIPIICEVSEGDEYIDYLESPYPMVSDNLKKLLKKYDANIFFKPLVFNDIKNEKQTLYWLMVPETIKCLSEKSAFNKNETAKKIIINEKKATPFKIFKPKETLETFIIVTLDVAESILRRGFTGMTFIQLEKGE